MKFWLISGFLTLSLYATGQIAPESMNQAAFYTPGTELVVNKVAWKPSEVIVQYRSDRVELLEVTLNSYSSYKSKKPISSTLIKAVCENSNCNFMVDMTDFVPDDVYLIVFKDIDTEDQFFVALDPGEELLSPVLITNAFEDIILDRYLLTGTEVYPKALKNKKFVHIYYYSESFRPADAPAGVSSIPSRGLQPDRVTTIQTGDRLELKEAGLYFLQTDTSSRVGYGFRVHDSPYPVYNSLEDLKNCMIYITTSQEWKALTQNQGKKSFDNIWMEAGGNENNAKSAIRNYYRNIASANRLFSSYKEGWKTDKGMIYAVFGPPNTVTKTMSGESWAYEYSEKTDPLVFNFINKPNIFSPYHSILARKKDYAPKWHYTIDKLRQGIQLNE